MSVERGHPRKKSTDFKNILIPSFPDQWVYSCVPKFASKRQTEWENYTNPVHEFEQPEWQYSLNKCINIGVQNVVCKHSMFTVQLRIFTVWSCFSNEVLYFIFVCFLFSSLNRIILFKRLQRSASIQIIYEALSTN